MKEKHGVKTTISLLKYSRRRRVINDLHFQPLTTHTTIR